MIADRLVEHFVAAGLMVREWDRVKLHGTVMNTLFRKDSTGKGITHRLAKQRGASACLKTKLLTCCDITLLTSALRCLPMSPYYLLA